MSDENGKPMDDLVKTIFDVASHHDIKVALHIEPYKGRNPFNLRQNLQYIFDVYGQYSSFYRRNGKPVFYIYDSYLTPVKEWKKLLTRSGTLTIRNTALDATFIGLIVEYKHRFSLQESGFDGFYTYFAANGFSHGSTWKNWRGLATFARKNSLLFIPSVGPGYDDMRVRPWNG